MALVRRFLLVIAAAGVLLAQRPVPVQSTQTRLAVIENNESHIQSQLEQIQAHLSAIDSRLNILENRMSGLETRMATLEVKMSMIQWLGATLGSLILASIWALIWKTFTDRKESAQKPKD
jgi:septal ring factor EnvC (AmiA/AmiB activator)